MTSKRRDVVSCKQVINFKNYVNEDDLSMLFCCVYHLNVAASAPVCASTGMNWNQYQSYDVINR